MKMVAVKDKGHPRAFETDKDFIDKVKEYLYICEYEWKQYPNIAGFCTYSGICRDTFYQQKLYYPDTYKKVQDMLENMAINSRNASDTMKIFYLKNKFQYRNLVMNEAGNDNINPTLDFSDLSLEELIELNELFEKVK